MEFLTTNISINQILGASLGSNLNVKTKGEICQKFAITIKQTVIGLNIIKKRIKYFQEVFPTAEKKTQKKKTIRKNFITNCIYGYIQLLTKPYKVPRPKPKRLKNPIKIRLLQGVYSETKTQNLGIGKS